MITKKEMQNFANHWNNFSNQIINTFQQPYRVQLKSQYKSKAQKILEEENRINEQVSLGKMSLRYGNELKSNLKNIIEDDEGYFQESFSDSMANFGRRLIGGRITKRRDKNVKQKIILPNEVITFDDYEGEQVNARLLRSNDDQNMAEQIVGKQIDYLDNIFHTMYRDEIFETIKSRMEELPPNKVIKIQLGMILDYSYFGNHNDRDQNERFIPKTSSRTDIVKRNFSDQEIEEVIDELWDSLRSQYSKTLDNHVPIVSGSGWIVSGHRSMSVDMDFMSNQFGQSHILADKFVKNNIINVQNKNDNLCLLYCYFKHLEVLDGKKQLNPREKALNKAKVKALLQNHPELHKLIDISMDNKDEMKKKVQKIEEILQQDINILYYRVCEDEDILNIKPTNEGKFRWMTNTDNFDEHFYSSMKHNKKNQYTYNRNHVMNLLMLHSSDGVHFTLIKNLDGIFKGCINYDKKIKVCPRSLSFQKTENQEKWFHEHICGEYGRCKPLKRVNLIKNKKDKYGKEKKELETMRFKHYNDLLPVPVTIEADFESTLIKASEENIDNNHQVNSYCFKVSSKYDLQLPKTVFRYTQEHEHEKEEHIISRFLEESKKTVATIQKRLEKLSKDFKKPSLEEKRKHNTEYKKAMKCVCCEQAFDNKDRKKVFHHDHLNGEYLGAMCQTCNSKITVKPKANIPVLFHNFKGYDSHLILKNLKMEDWILITDKKNIYWMKNKETNQIEIVKDRQKIMNLLNNHEYNYRRASYFEHEIYNTFLIFKEEKEIEKETLLVDHLNYESWFLTDERRNETMVEIERLEKLEKIFKFIGKEYLKNKTYDEVKDIYNAFHQFFRGRDVNYENDYGKEKVIKSFLILKEKYNNIYNAMKEFECIFENSQRVKTFSFRGMKFLDSIAYFGVGFGLANLANTVKYSEKSPDEFENLIEACRGGKEKVSGEEYEKLKLKDKEKLEQHWLKELNEEEKERYRQYKIEIAKKQFPSLFQHYHEFPEESIELLSRKGVYPYNYMDSYHKLNLVGLPPQEAFYNDLLEENISDIEYAHAKNVYEKFGCRTFRDYHNLYLETDVLLLSDVLANFKSSISHYFGMDPLHSISLPSFAERAMLYSLFKKQKEIGLLDNDQIDTYKLIQKNIRGGICNAIKRYTKKRNDTEIMYFDANALYLWAERNFLPVGNFVEYKNIVDELQSENGFVYNGKKFTSQIEFQNYLDNRIDISENPTELIKYREFQNKGEFLLCDVKIPEQHHDKFNDYPPCVEKKQIFFSDLGEENKIKFDKKKNANSKTKVSDGKLIPNLEEKKDYLIHSALFSLYRRQGVEFTIKEVIQFDQESILKDFVEIAMELRKKSTSEFHKTLFKLINNALYGRMLMNPDRYKSMEMVFNSDVDKKIELDRLDKVLHQQIVSRTLINEDLVLFEKEKATSNYNRPISVGFAVLDLSKTLMANYFYNVFQKNWNCSLLYTDCDSFILEFETENLCQDLLDKKVTHLFDFSNMDSDLVKEGNIYHQLLQQEKEDIRLGRKEKKGNGLMKNENDWREIEEVVCLSAKCYSIQETNGKQKMTAKAVRKTIHKQLHHRIFKYIAGIIDEEEFEQEKKRFKKDNDFEFQDGHVKGPQKGIQSKKHQISTINVSKILLNNFNDKRFDDQYAYGHYKTKK
jgi:DNA-directed RNA polymerase subunit RPC12/RpoP